MEPKGVRLTCDQCTFSTVATDPDPDALPPGVNKKLYDSFICPNCPGDLPL